MLGRPTLAALEWVGTAQRPCRSQSIVPTCNGQNTAGVRAADRARALSFFGAHMAPTGAGLHRVGRLNMPVLKLLALVHMKYAPLDHQPNWKHVAEED